MPGYEIALWTISLVLATSGLSFGIVASINSRKANTRIQALVSDSWIIEESQKRFFKEMQKIVASNNIAIRELRKNLKFFDYSILSSATRWTPIPDRVMETLRKSEYREISEHFMEMKRKSDMIFKEIVPDFKILSTDTKISEQTSKDLVKFHQQIIRISKEIMKEYIDLMSPTKQTGV